MKSALLKNIIRDLRMHPGRFVALFLIIMLSSSFYVGLRAVSPSMNKTANDYFTRTRLADFRLQSTAGITRDDADAAENLEGVETVMPYYMADTMGNMGNESVVFRVYSLPEDTSSDNSNYLSQVTLLSGRMPREAGECIIDSRTEWHLGKENMTDTIVIPDGAAQAPDGILIPKKLKVVGVCYSPQYISIERGNTTIGTGAISDFVYVMSDAFDSKYYTEMQILMKDGRNVSAFSKKYDKAVLAETKRLETYVDERAQTRYDEMQAEIDEAVAKQREKYIAAVAAGEIDPAAPVETEEIPEAVMPEWSIFSRADNPGYSGFDGDSNRIASISGVITSFLYLVAALVCLTTMTRMVEEQRLLAGTLKAIGYKRRTVLFKFLFYAALVSIIGGVVGITVGYIIYPDIIWNAYATLYTMDSLKIDVAAITSIMGVMGGLAATFLATIAACYSELKLPAAMLMRPHAPKSGKRVLAERIGPLWRRLRFSAKVSIRNLFRYKKRLIMTIIGVAGCMALLVTGFGIRDSIGGMVDVQYNRITNYDITLYLDSASEKGAETPLNEKLKDVEDSEYVYQAGVSASNGNFNNSDMQTYMTVPENWNEFTKFITLRERVGGAKVELPQDDSGSPDVIITEKLARKLEVKQGDKIKFGLKGKKKFEVEVAGVTENYIYNYVYLNNEAYRTLFGKAPEYKSVLVISGTGDDETARDDLLNDLVDTQGVSSAMTKGRLVDIMNEIIKSLNAIVFVIIGVSGMLALVVLYNLMNINITERERELATLKVLGFYPREVYSYVGRESIMLTLLSILAGVPLGILLHRYIMTSVEISETMFGRDIHPISFLISGVFTLACAVFMNIVLRPKINRIDPVGSLKSAE
jgi:putative ABC transport system permease protein